MSAKFGLGQARVCQAGFSLPVAVFVLVIMSLLAAALVQLSSRGNLSATQEELSNRAFYAAESGASWAMSRLFFDAANPVSRASADAACAALGAPPALTASGLATCSIAVSCSSSGGANVSLYQIESTGRCGTGQATAQRSIEVGAQHADP